MMGEVTDIRARQAEPSADERLAMWRQLLDEGIRELNIPEYLTDDQVVTALAAWGMAGSLRSGAGTDGRRELWDRVSKALTDALSFDSPAEGDEVRARETEQLGVESRRDDIRSL